MGSPYAAYLTMIYYVEGFCKIDESYVEWMGDFSCLRVVFLLILKSFCIVFLNTEVVRVHTKVKSPTRKVTDTEKELVQKISHLLQNQTAADALLIMDLVRLGLIGATTGHSIVLHFLCSNVVDLIKLQDSLRSGRCRNLVGTTFHDLLPTKDIGEVDVKKFERDGEFIKSSFTGYQFFLRF